MADEPLDALARRLGSLLLERGWRLATAESSTGGMIGQAITRIPGASDYYVGGVIAYSNQAKQVDLAVPAELIAEHGAVSEAVAGAMATGAADRFGTEVAVSVTGIAGPEGGSSEKPVGLHYVAVAVRGQPARIERQVFPHDRDGNRRAAVELALRLTLGELQRLPVA